jgi:putative PIN family toxin of toxin-antitoxin system
VRIVLDTNVLLSGMFTRGLCEALLDLCLGTEEHTVIASEYLLHEFERAAVTKFAVPADRARQATQWLRKHMALVVPAPVPSDACRDPDDLPVLGTALAAQADCLVTGDADLLAIKTFRSIPILSPRTALARLA